MIAWVGFDDMKLGYRDSRLNVMNLDGSNKRLLTGSLDRSVSNPQWAGDSRSIYVEVEDGGVNRVERVGLDGSIREIASDMGFNELDRPYAGGAFTVSRNGVVAVTSGDPLHPNQVAVASGNGIRRLTRLSSSLLDSKVLGEVQKLAVSSEYEQRPIDAWMVTPPDYDPAKNYPMILEIHGGPYDAYGPQFSTDDQLYAAHGHVVVYSNPRGSTSYGEDFANHIDKAYPGPRL